MSVTGSKSLIASKLGHLKVFWRIVAWIFTTLVFILSLVMINSKVGGLPSMGKPSVSTCENSTSMTIFHEAEFLPWPTKSTTPVLLLQLLFGAGATICAIGARSLKQKAYLIRNILISVAISIFFILLFCVPKGLKSFPPPPNPNSPVPKYFPGECITRYY